MNSTMKDEEEESVLPLEEQKTRPKDVAVQQQRVQAWHPILDPEWVIYSFLALAVIMIPVGFKMESLSEDVVQLLKIYDPDPDQNCGIGMNYNANKNCTIKFAATEDMKPPILVYYQLENFYQNHRAYVSSRDDYQLTGQVNGQTKTQAETCAPLNKLGGITLNPCGLIANTFFNDRFELISGKDVNGNDLQLVEEGIAWTSDLEYRFKMPDGYQQEPCEVCDASCCQALNFSCKEPAISKQDELCYAYDYPNDDTTQYLYETYPNIISPLEHVTNEHFVVWMRIATRPKFRKLYGYIQQEIPKGTEFSFQINLNYVVESFEGSKAIIVSTNNIMGGYNPYLGPTIYYMGFFFLACGIFFAAKHWFRPRKLGDRKYLHYKEA